MLWNSIYAVTRFRGKIFCTTYKGGCYMEIDFIVLGKRIKEIRTRNQISQEELSYRADVTPQYISIVETGKKKVSLQVLVNIADALEVSVDELLIGNQASEIQAVWLEVSNLLEDCNRYEKRVVHDQIVSLVKTLKENRKLL